jgi:excisionase family DNA binding protein
MVMLIMPGYSTREAAEKLGISFPTINRHIADKKIPFPPLVKVGGVTVRLWSDADVERVRQILPKISNGRKTRYEKHDKKKKKPKSKP